MPKSKSNKKTTGKGAAEKSSKTKKNKSASKDKSKNIYKNSFLNQAAPYIFAVVAVLIAVCVIAGEGSVGGGVRRILTGLFAGGAYVLPVMILLRSILWNRDIEEGQNVGRTTAHSVHNKPLA